MKICFLILIFIFAFLSWGDDFNSESIKKDSEIKIVHIAHDVINFFLKTNDGNRKERMLNRIEYRATCSKGDVKIKKSYFTAKNKALVKEEKRKINEYISLWKDLINIGLKELDFLFLDDAVDPFEFIDSWRSGKDTYNFNFKFEGRTITFNLYDIESYRDNRFKSILKRIMVFFGE